MSQDMYDFLSGLWMAVSSLSFLFVMIKFYPYFSFIPNVLFNVGASIILLAIVLLGLKVLKKIQLMKNK